MSGQRFEDERKQLESVLESCSKEVKRLSRRNVELREQLDRVLKELHEFRCADCDHPALDCAGQFVNRDDEPEGFDV